MADTLLYRARPPVAEIILNQPGKRNAINAAMWAALGPAVRRAADDAAIRVIIVRGEGDHFAAGADITEFEAVYGDGASAQRYTQTMLGALAALEAAPKPCIAAIRGSCVGGGCSIALACDLRFASHSARLGVTPGKLGLVYSLADTRRLAQATGVANAKDLLFTGRLIDAPAALEMGLVDRLYKDSDLAGGVEAFADEIASTSPFSADATKRTFALLAAGAADDDPAASALMAEAFAGPDFQKGYRAFLAKKKPDFTSD